MESDGADWPAGALLDVTGSGQVRWGVITARPDWVGNALWLVSGVFRPTKCGTCLVDGYHWRTVDNRCEAMRRSQQRLRNWSS